MKDYLKVLYLALRKLIILLTLLLIPTNAVLASPLFNVSEEEISKRTEEELKCRRFSLLISAQKYVDARESLKIIESELKEKENKIAILEEALKIGEEALASYDGSGFIVLHGRSYSISEIIKDLSEKSSQLESLKGSRNLITTLADSIFSKLNNGRDYIIQATMELNAKSNKERLSLDLDKVFDRDYQRMGLENYDPGHCRIIMRRISQIPN